MQQLSFLVAPIVPLVCFALVLWLDRLEESLDIPSASSAEPMRAGAAVESSPGYAPPPSPPTPVFAVPATEGSRAD